MHQLTWKLKTEDIRILIDWVINIRLFEFITKCFITGIGQIKLIFFFVFNMTTQRVTDLVRTEYLRCMFKNTVDTRFTIVMATGSLHSISQYKTTWFTNVSRINLLKISIGNFISRLHFNSTCQCRRTAKLILVIINVQFVSEQSPC